MFASTRSMSDERLLCAAAARIGDLEALASAAPRGEFLSDERRLVGGVGRPPRDAVGVRERLPVGQADVRGCGDRRLPRGTEVGARERLPAGTSDAARRRAGRPPRDARAGARERLPVERVDVRDGAKGGHLEMLKWARENDCPWNERTRARARGGHLEVRVGRANGCPGPSSAAPRARGHLEVLKGARERLPVERADARARRRPPRGAEGARANGCPWTEQTWRTRRRASPRGAEVGYENDCPWDEDVRVPARVATSMC